MQKFKRTTDLDLFELWKEKDPDAEAEFIERYKRRSIDLATKLLDDFKEVTRSDKEELINIGLYSLFVALTHYNGRGTFFGYWKKIATHRMMDDIKYHSFSYQNKEYGVYNPYCSYNDDVFSGVLSSSSYNSNFSNIYDELEAILNEESLKISSDDKRLFLLYVDGYTIAELALIFDMSYAKAKYKIAHIKRMIKDILFNS